jgi:dienelactone hydrolase
MWTWRWWATTAIAALLAGLAGLGGLAGLAGCTTPPPSTRATIEVDSPTALSDEPVHIRVTGLRSGETAEVSATATDYEGAVWRASGTFAADGDGVVDLVRDAPTAGSYEGVDGMGLFWSMTPPSGDPDESAFGPAAGPSFEVRLTASVAARVVAEQALTRVWLSDDAAFRELTLDADGVVGGLYLPPPGAGTRSPVLLIGGSDGFPMGYQAALLASRGHPALALSYFNAPGLPDAIREIPLEYFAAAARVLAAQPGVRASRVAVLGYSRGTEPALLLAEHYPDLVHGAVVYAPSSQVDGGFPGGGYAWTHRGEPLSPQLDIPLGNVAGPVLAVAGGNDRLWPAEASTVLIMRELAATRDRYPHDALVYPDAGHGVGTFPFLPIGTVHDHPINGVRIEMGGTRAADQAARRDGWPKVLDFLAALPAG